MATKVLLRDKNENIILPITRGELVLDSSGKVALHSAEFLATGEKPGLMSSSDKAKLDSVAGGAIDDKLDVNSSNPVLNKVLTQIINSIKEKYLKSASTTPNRLTLVDQDDSEINFYNTTYNVVTNTEAGLAPLIVTATDAIQSPLDEWVLTSKNGETPTWKKLPINAFSNDNSDTTYSINGLLSGNNYIITLKDSSDEVTTAVLSPFVGSTDSSAGLSGIVPSPTILDRLKFLRGDGTWATMLQIELNWDNILNKPETFTPEEHRHSTNHIVDLQGYSIASDKGDLLVSDTLNTALGKLEYKTNLGVTAYDWYRSVTGEDTDDIINKWGEIVDFIGGITEDTDILSKFVTIDTALTITGVKTFSSRISFPVNTGIYYNNQSGLLGVASKGQWTGHPGKDTYYTFVGTTSYNTILRAKETLYSYRNGKLYEVLDAGNLYAITKLHNFYSERQTSLKPAIIGDGSMYQFKSTYVVTDQTDDPGEGHILHFEWDNDGGYSSQLFIQNHDGLLKTRGMNGKDADGNARWGNWILMISTKDILLKSRVLFEPNSTDIQPTTLNNSFLTAPISIARGLWSYDGNGYTSTPFGYIDLAGTTVIKVGANDSEFTLLFITPPTATETNALRGELLYYIDNGSSYYPTWYRVLTNANYQNILPVKLVSTPTRQTLVSNYGLPSDYETTGYKIEDYLKALTRYLLSIGKGHTCIGTLQPSVSGSYICYVYDTTIDSTTNLPKYFVGTAFLYNALQVSFGTYTATDAAGVTATTWYYRAALNSSNYTNYTLNKFQSMQFTKTANGYVNASFLTDELKLAAADKYIEFWDTRPDGNENLTGWFNSKWGKVTAAHGFEGNVLSLGDKKLDDSRDTYGTGLTVASYHSAHTPGWPGNYGEIITVGDARKGYLQIAGAYNVNHTSTNTDVTTEMYLRSWRDANATSWSDWTRILSDRNYTAVLDNTYIKYINAESDVINNTNNNPTLINAQNSTIVENFGNYWNVFNMGSYTGNNFRTLLAMPYISTLRDSELFLRSANGSSWRAWRRVLHTGNYKSIIQRKATLAGGSGTALKSAGWYRCATIIPDNRTTEGNVIISLSRSYNSPEDEHYIFSISSSYYSPHTCITQLSGYGPTGKLIPKVRLVYGSQNGSGGPYYFDFYYNGESYSNSFVVEILAGDCNSIQTPTLTTSSVSYYAELATTNGVASNYGFTGTFGNFGGPVTLTGTTADTAKIKFSRSGETTWNYILWPGNTSESCLLAFGYNHSAAESYYYMSSKALYPATNNTRSLGTDTMKWSNVYATTFTGNLEGKASKIALNKKTDEWPTYGDYGEIIQSTSEGPTGSWHNSLKILHNNSKGYYTQLALTFTGEEGLWHRRCTEGNKTPWKKVIDSSNIGSQSVSHATTTERFKLVISNSGDLNTALSSGGLARNYNSYMSKDFTNAPASSLYGMVLQLTAFANSNALAGQLAWDVNHNSATDTTRYLWWRAGDSESGFAKSVWHRIAFTDACLMLNKGINIGGGSELVPITDIITKTGGYSLTKTLFYYAGNGYITTTKPDGTTMANLDLAGASILTFGDASAYTHLFITAPTQSGHSGITNEMLFYLNHGSDYSPGWTRVLTNRNYKSIVVGEAGSGTSDFSDGTEILTSYASDSGFSSAGYVNEIYKRKASSMFNYIKTKAAVDANAFTSYTSKYLKVYTKSDSQNYPILFAGGIGSSSGTDRGIYTDSVNSLYYNPSSNVLTSYRFASTVATGTAPMTISSTTVVSNLNADMVDGKHASDFAIPVGTIMMWAGSTAPTGWLLCNGAAVSRTTYSALFAVISTTYGTGDGSTTFNVPNLQRRFPLGALTGSWSCGSQTYTTTRGYTGGEKAHTLTVSEMPSHNHTLNVYRDDDGGGGVAEKLTPYSSGEAGSTASSYSSSSGYPSISNKGGSASHNNIPPFLAINFIIKY